MEPQPQLQIADFLKDKKFVVDQKIGYAWEHVDIQFGPQGHLALKQPYVRQALITGINRSRSLVPCTRRSPLDCRSHSHMFKPFEANYKQNWAVYKFNQQKVIDILQKKGCTGGPSKPAANNQSIFSCPNVGKLSFRFGTTTGNRSARSPSRSCRGSSRASESSSSLASRSPARCSARRFRRVTGTWSCSRGSAARRLRSRSRTSTPVVATRTT